MYVVLSVTVENLVERFLRAHFNYIVLFRQRINDADLASTLCESTDAVASFILPPWHLEVRFPLGTRISRWYMQEAALWTHVLSRACLLVDIGPWLLVLWIKPVSNISASCKDNRITLRPSVVLINQQGQIVDLVEERYPNVAGCVVCCDLGRSIEATELVGTWDVLGLFDAGGAGLARRWNSGSHV